MPEIAEVETVRHTLKKRILHQKITKIEVYYEPIILNQIDEFKQNLLNESFIDIKRRGKWLLFETEKYYLCSHLRMEGKYFIKGIEEPIEKHEHVVFTLNHHITLRYHDTRKFGRMYLVLKNHLEEFPGIHKQGIEPISDDLTVNYLYSKLKRHHLPLKTLLLDQTIISGLGNIYANEVLFASGISPFKKGNEITKKECERIIVSAKEIITEAILMGGTTIRSYTSSLGVTGHFQQNLKVHKREGKPCFICGTPIKMERIGGRSTYYCPKCQISKIKSKKIDYSF